MINAKYILIILSFIVLGCNNSIDKIPETDSNKINFNAQINSIIPTKALLRISFLLIIHQLAFSVGGILKIMQQTKPFVETLIIINTPKALVVTNLPAIPMPITPSTPTPY